MNAYFKRGQKQTIEINGISIYSGARKQARFSPEETAEQLHISRRTLDYYEAGEVPVPAETVVAMSNLYNTPLLMPLHCRLVCPIGKVCGLDIDDIEMYQLAVQFIKEFQDVHDRMQRFIAIISDGAVQEYEKIEWSDILREVAELEQKAAQLRFLDMTRRKSNETATAIAVPFQSMSPEFYQEHKF